MTEITKNNDNEPNSEGQSNKLKPIAITIKDKKVLYSSYMYFLKYGGLFIPTDPTNFKMLDEISMIISLLDDPEKYTVEGRVVWITPHNSQGNKASGIGLEFTGQMAIPIRAKIENILAGSLKSTEGTHTM